ncbi:hypothetical protein ECZU51_17310 [Escherichia coli]|nr:hypothetical protein ECZU51_17310 [Escherichia coli]
MAAIDYSPRCHRLLLRQVQAKVRATLLAGIRAAVLWHRSAADVCN